MKNKAEVWEDIESKAQKFRDANPDLELTREQAIDRVLTPELIRQHRDAPDPKPAVGDPWQGRSAEKAVYDRIVLKASELRQRKPKLTEAQAFDEVWNANPEARTKFRMAQEVDRKYQATRGQKPETKRVTQAAPIVLSEPRSTIVHVTDRMLEMAKRF